MTPPWAWLDQALMQRWGIALLHFVWQGGLLALMLAVMQFPLRRGNPQTRYLAACATLFLMAAAPLCTFYWLPIPVAGRDSLAATVGKVSSNHAQERAAAEPTNLEQPPPQKSVMVESAVATLEFVAGFNASQPATPIADQHGPAGAKGEHTLGDMTAPAEATGPVPTPATAEPSPVASGKGPTAITAPGLLTVRADWLLNVLLACWATGVLVLALRLVGGWWLAERMRRRLVEPLAETWNVMFLRMCQRLQIPRAVGLLESARIRVPAVIGWLSPVVLLPLGLVNQLTPQQIEAILAHELAHVRRHDFLVNLLQCVVETLLFYHPGVWWVSHHIRLEREYCCDDLAVAACGNPLHYARALADLETLRVVSPGSIALAATGGSLLDRIQRVVGLPNHSHPSAKMLAGAVVLVLPLSILGVTHWDRQPEAIGGTVAIRDALPTTAQSNPAPATVSVPEAIAEPADDAPVPSDPAPRLLLAKDRLRYRWQPGAQHVYQVKLEADDRGLLTTHEGKSTYHVQSTADDGSAQLHHTGRLIPWTRTESHAMGPRFPFPAGMAMGPPRFGPWWQGSVDATLHVTALGKVLRQGPANPLPYLLDDLARLMVVPLDPEQKTWTIQRERDCTIETADGNMPGMLGPRGGFPSRFPSGFRGGFGGDPFDRQQTTTYPALEEVKYQLTKVAEKAVSFEITLDVQTVERINDLPRFQTRGQGTFVLDIEAGIPQSLTMQLTHSMVEGASTRQIPVTLAVELLPPEATVPPTAPTPPQLPAPVVLTDEGLTRLLADLASAESFRSRAASDQLLSVDLQLARREEVAAALLQSLARSEGYARASIARALGTWGTEQSTEPLVACLDDEAHAVRWGAMEALGRLRDPRAAVPLAAVLSTDTLHAEWGLIALGTPAETAVIPYLQDKAATVQLAACRVLAEIGSETSLAPLQALLDTGAPETRAAAQQAREKITARAKK